MLSACRRTLSRSAARHSTRQPPVLRAEPRVPRLPPSRSVSSAPKMADFKKVYSDKAMTPAGPYSQAVIAGGFTYVSGCIPADKDGNLTEGSIADKTEQCCRNIIAVLEAAGTSIDKVVKTTVFLDDMANFAEMNGRYESFFSHKPARSCVAVKQLPKGVPVEIECIALAPST